MKVSIVLIALIFISKKVNSGGDSFSDSIKILQKFEDDLKSLVILFESTDSDGRKLTQNYGKLAKELEGLSNDKKFVDFVEELRNIEEPIILRGPTTFSSIPWSCDLNFTSLFLNLTLQIAANNAEIQKLETQISDQTAELEKSQFLLNYMKSIYLNVDATRELIMTSLANVIALRQQEIFNRQLKVYVLKQQNQSIENIKIFAVSYENYCKGIKV